MKVEIKAWRPEGVVFLVAALLALPCNLVLWGHVADALPSHGWHKAVFLLAAVVLLAAALALVLLLLPLRWLGRPLLTLLLPLSALTAYFMQRYGVAIDDAMIRNVFETDTAEALQLVSLPMLVQVLFLGVLPVVLVWRVQLRPVARWPALRARLLAILSCLAVIGLVAMLFYPGLASLFRNHREFRFYLVPNNFVNGVRHYVSQEEAVAKVPLQAVGVDARRSAAVAREKRPRLLVLVIGETARGDHFSLNGYARNTNPRLRATPGLINFPDAHSCGTETAVSLPCMLSNLGTDGFSNDKAEARENLLDVVARAGVDVVWVENQSGCKRTCDRVRRIHTEDLKLAPYCHDGECFDEILVEVLKRELPAIKRDTLVVLHQMGSHGPAYYLRYPPAFERFTPGCRTNLLDQCSQEQIRNTYDNTLLYTDHVIASLVEVLRASPQVDSAFLYLSDHGESLGEYGMYLHGAPRMLAPQAQTHIPLLAWLSPGFQSATGISERCVASRREQAVTHDNLFHSVLGLLAVETLARNPVQDLFTPCATPLGRRGKASG